MKPRWRESREPVSAIRVGLVRTASGLSPIGIRHRTRGARVQGSPARIIRTLASRAPIIPIPGLPGRISRTGDSRHRIGRSRLPAWRRALPPLARPVRRAVTHLLWISILCPAVPARSQTPPRLYYEMDGRGPAVVFIADWAHDTSSWFRILPALRPGFQLVRYDLRGQGRSEVPAQGDQGLDPYALDAHREDLMRLLDGLEIDRAHVIASGLGARVAIAAASRTPERVASLTLINPHMAWTDVELGWWGRFLTAFNRVGRPSVGEYAALLADQWFGAVFVGRQPWIVPFCDLMLRRQDPEALVTSLRAWLATDLTLDATAPSEIPVLVVRGGGAGEAIGELRLRNAFPRLKQVFLRGSGRFPQLDNPAFLGDAVRQYLDGVERARYPNSTR